MRKRFLAGCLMAALALSLIGCGKKKNTDTQTETTDQSQEDTSEEEDTKESTDTAAADNQVEPAHDSAVAEELEKMSAVSDGVIYAMYQPDISKDGVSYVPSDAQFFWLCICFTANNMKDTVEGVTADETNCVYTVPADVISAYAKACFGSGQTIPDIPQEVSYAKKDGDNYQITMGDAGDMGFTLTKAYKNSDDTYTGIFELSTSEGLLGTYRLTYKADTDGDALFPYNITNAVLVK